ncbi:MAG: transcriptional regulator [Microbacteriaceae bacterium]|nr:transcriptional regulator [Microbacteriaceae bacterium]
MNGSNLDQVRRGNLSTVLGLVHTKGAPSRAWLTRETGLNRSTIAALVAELVQLGLVVEAGWDQTNQVGRPSPIIRASGKRIAIAVRPELDAIDIGLVALDGTVIRRVHRETERAPTAREAVDIAAAEISELLGNLDASYRPVAIGLVVPGLVRESDGLVSIAPHLGWSDEPVAVMLQEATGLDVYSANDANAGAIAESTFGAGRGVSELIYLNGGASGIGGGIVIGGDLLRGANGFAGELGHTLVNSAGIACHCGSSGCLETEVSRQQLLEALGLSIGDAERLDDVLLAAFAPGATVPSALAELVERQLGFLAIALGNATNLFNPRMIVLGGFLGSLYGAAPGVLDEAIRHHAMAATRDGLVIQRAALGSNILMIGAAELAFADLLGNPA